MITVLFFVYIIKLILGRLYRIINKFDVKITIINYIWFNL